MVLMNQPSVDRFLPRLRVGKVAFVNSSLASGTACTGVVEIPANQIALELGDVQAANVVMIGAMLGRERLLDHGKALEAVRKASAPKGEKAVELNQKAFEKGWELGVASREPLQKTA
jgi:2-oxoglutarate ferredoxin oxidoreductase subunit gamma